MGNPDPEPSVPWDPDDPATQRRLLRNALRALRVTDPELAAEVCRRTGLARLPETEFFPGASNVEESEVLEETFRLRFALAKRRTSKAKGGQTSLADVVADAVQALAETYHEAIKAMVEQAAQSGRPRVEPSGELGDLIKAIRAEAAQSDTAESSEETLDLIRSVAGESTKEAIELKKFFVKAVAAQSGERAKEIEELFRQAVAETSRATEPGAQGAEASKSLADLVRRVADESGAEESPAPAEKEADRSGVRPTKRGSSDEGSSDERRRGSK